MKEQAINEILDILDKDKTYIVVQKRGNREKINLYKFIHDTILYGNNGYRELNISKDTFSRNMQKLFGKKPKQSTQWYIYLLLMTSYKRCNKCQKILDLNNFSKDLSTSDKLKNRCKYCDNKMSATYKKENRESVLKSGKLYDKNNYEKRLAKNAQRRANKLKATPKWHEKERITELYKQSSKETHIDHIIPLQSNLVCGLHCFDNLQAIPAKEKGNSFEQDFESMEHMEWLIEHGEAC